MVTRACKKQPGTSKHNPLVTLYKSSPMSPKSWTEGGGGQEILTGSWKERVGVGKKGNNWLIFQYSSEGNWRVTQCQQLEALITIPEAK